MNGKMTILLFVSRESATYQFTHREIKNACSTAFGNLAKVQLKVIDVADEPELAEKYNIEVLPTMIIENKRFVGTPTQDMLESCMGMSSPPPKRKKRRK